MSPRGVFVIARVLTFKDHLNYNLILFHYTLCTYIFSLNLMTLLKNMLGIKPLKITKKEAKKTMIWIQ